MIAQLDKSPKAILFDMDGVLIDSQDAWWKAVNDALSYSHHQTITKQDFIDNLWGNDFEQSLSYLGVNKNVFLVCDTWPKVYLNHVRLMDDAVSTLTSLHHSFKLAVITNTERFITKQVLSEFQLSSFFKEVICADDVKKGKPAPDMIYKACDLLHTKISDVVVIGDTKNDYFACQQAGCHMIGMRFNNGGAMVKQLSDLPVLLNQLSK
jgi:HAD superfamily hydrolase (TIGR01549 family)